MGLQRSWQGIAVALVIAGVVVGGCAKRPATTQVSAPPPVGSAAAGTAGAGTAGMQAGSGSTTQGGTGLQSGTGSGTQSGSGLQSGGAAGAQSGAAGAGAARPEPREFAESPALGDIYFDFDKSDIRPDAAKTLNANAGWMKSNPKNLILIEGHCDERGTNEYNLALGERRARSTLNYLVGQGVPASRITIISYGEERPTCTEKTEACWAKNRRAHFLVKAQ